MVHLIKQSDFSIGDFVPLYAYNGEQPSLPADDSVWIAPSADLIGDVRLEAGSSVWFGAVIRADNTPIKIGSGTNVQDGAMLHSDPGSPLTIGGEVTVGHHAILHGCTIGDRVLIGMGAVVLNHAVIGDDCLVGAGALVTEGKIFPPGSLIVGAPAQAKRVLAPAAIAVLKESANGYREKASLYRRNLTRIR
jgi:carbonic anhydrase/acetyltransferase-like protein (isoleucine patch superfamily)